MHKTLISFLLLIISVNLLSQPITNTWHPSNQALLDGKTIIKVNLLGIPTRNFGFYGERILSKRISFVMGLNTMPNGKIPYIELFTEEPEIQNIEISSISLTPEIRFYLSPSGYGKGFYIAPYYKYERYNAKSYNIEFIDEDAQSQFIDMHGNLNTHSVGAIIGVQWLFGKKNNVSLDWTIIGAHYGSNKGQLKGNTTYEMSEKVQDDIIKTIEDSFGSINIGNIVPVKTENITIDSHNASIDIKTPWAFIRTALSIGIRF